MSPNFKLCLITEGNAVWQLGSRYENVAPGDIVVLDNQHKRKFVNIFPDSGIEILVIEFDPQIFIRAFQGILYNYEENHPFKLNEHQDISQLFFEIEKEDIDKLCHYNLIKEAKIAEILSLVSRYMGITNLDDVKLSDGMHEVVLFINRNFNSNITLKEAADIVYMSESGFSKRFLKCMGIGFSHYIMQLRIGYATELLQNTEKTVFDIALECGYNNTANFYKAFKKVTQQTPSDFRGINNFYI